MRVKEGSIVPINLFCGHGERRVVVLDGKKKLVCPKCGKTIFVNIAVNSKGDVVHFGVG